MKKYEYEPGHVAPKVGDLVIFPGATSDMFKKPSRVTHLETTFDGRYSAWADNMCWPLEDFPKLYRVVKRKSSETILEEAQRLTSGDRNADYGHPLDDYSKTGMIWGALLHAWAMEAAKSKTPIPVPPELACLCMTGVKLSREVNKSKRDNLVDGAGYLRLVEMIQDERKKREGK